MDGKTDRSIDLNMSLLHRSAIKGYARKKIVHSPTCFYHPLFLTCKINKLRDKRFFPPSFSFVLMHIDLFSLFLSMCFASVIASTFPFQILQTTRGGGRLAFFQIKQCFSAFHHFPMTPICILHWPSGILERKKTTTLRVELSFASASIPHWRIFLKKNSLKSSKNIIIKSDPAISREGSTEQLACLLWACGF